MKLVITGSEGIVGRLLMAAFPGAIGVDRVNGADVVVDFDTVDYASEPMRGVLAGADAIIHLAAEPYPYKADAAHWQSVINAARFFAAAAAAGVPRFVVASSGWAVPMAGQYLSPYSHSKRVMEALADMYDVDTAASGASCASAGCRARGTTSRAIPNGSRRCCGATSGSSPNSARRWRTDRQISLHFAKVPQWFFRLSGGLPMTTELRPADPLEADAIRDLVRAAYAKWMPVIGREPRPMQVDYRNAVHQHQFDALVADGRIVGVIETELRGDHVWIENVAVLPESQGKGLGRRLLAHAERKAIEAGCLEVRLLTNGAFAANLSLYGSLGYIVDRQEDFMNGTAVYMSKKLTR